MKRRYSIIVLSFLCLIFFTSFALGDTINVDQIIYWPDPNFSGTLSASIDISQNGGRTDSFLLTLTNTTPYNPSYPNPEPTTVTLTGVGFVLPNGLNIVGGSIITEFANNPSGNSEEAWWGFANKSNGPFLNIATLPTDTSVSTLSAVVDTRFAGPPPSSIDGPKGGIAPAGYVSIYPTNWDYFSSSAQFLISLSGDITDFDEFVKSINNGNVVVAFSSPTAVAVPEPSTLLLLGAGLVGLGIVGRKKRK